MAYPTPQLLSVHAIAACSPYPGRVELFVAGDTGEVWQKSLDNGGEKPWQSHGKPWPSDTLSESDRLMAESRVEAQIRLVAKSTATRQSWSTRHESGKWTGWSAIDHDTYVAAALPDEALEQLYALAPIISGGERHVATISRSGVLDLFAIWNEIAMVRRRWDGAWSEWELLDVFRAPPGPYKALRPRDMVSLVISGRNIREQVGAGGRPEWVAEGGRGRLIVDLPPQHVAEAVLPAGQSSSSGRLAGPSSLHFEVTNQRVQLSVEGILTAMKELPLAAGAPHGQASTLEFPWSLLLGLAQKAHCSHRTTATAAADGATELWHTHVFGPGAQYSGVHPFKNLGRDVPFANQSPIIDSELTAIATQGAVNPEPMKVDRLILTPCGAWFSGVAEFPQVRWTHRSAMARDFYVQVVTRGLIFPFGHRGSVVRTTERRFEGGVAGLRAEYSLIILEPERKYEIGTARHQREFPFQKVEIEPRFIAHMDDPGTADAFWPKRDGEPVIFSVRGWAGSEVVNMRLPLLFSKGGVSLEALDGLYARGPRSGPESASVRPSSFVGRFIPLAMKNANEAFEGASQQVQSLTFGGGSAPGQEFYPRITEMVVALPAASQLLGQELNIRATLSRAFVESTSSTPPDALLDIAQTPLKFGSARTGVVAAPTVAVNRIQRLKGPSVEPLPTNPAALFGDDAKLLGVVPLKNIIADLGPPPMITWTGGANPGARMQWQQPINKSSGPFKPLAGSLIDLTVVASAGKVTTDGKVTNFDIVIPSAMSQPNEMLIKLHASLLKFSVEAGRLPSIEVDITSAELGSYLSFVKTLSQYLKIGGSGPKVSMTGSAIRVAYVVAIPTPIPVGPILTIYALRIEAGITLSLTNQPVTVDFSFGTRGSPFLVTVSGFGGGGYLELGIGAGENAGLQRLVGGIEFGAAVAMDFGIAAGEVHVFGGIVFTKSGQVAEITGYLRIGGMVRVLGLISVSVELTVSLTYILPPENVLRGAAKLVITVDLTFWSTSVELTCEKSFKGPDLLAGETAVAGAVAASVVATLGPAGESFPWRSYCRAFANE